MKINTRFILVLSLYSLFLIPSKAAEPKPLAQQKWGHVCSGKMPEEWYASDEALSIAEVVMAVQKTNGGWMKNSQMHKLSEEEMMDLMRKKRDHSCLDNYATTQEMRFLAHVYRYNKDERYRTSFLRGLEMILAAQKGCGGWSQYWPLTGKGSYQDYITFNDDLMTNVMLLLRDVYQNEGDFQDLADEATRTRCREAFDKGVACILRCQIDDEGVPSVWCAQHDTVTFLPAEGRPHELPTFCGSESAALLEFLMSIENPSKELQAAIDAAVAWLDTHKIADKAIEKYTNAAGEDDRRIVDQPGNALWGRFIQLGGKTAKKTQKLFVKHLEARNKTRKVVYKGKEYQYMEADNARESYDPSKAYQPVYAIYKDTLQNLYYRYLYHYEDTPPVTDWQGVPQRTSLMAVNRAKYQFLGNWCWEVIYGEYPMWKERVEGIKEAATHGWQQITVTKEMLSNTKGKEYNDARLGTIKLSPTTHHIALPEGKQVVRVVVHGFSNTDHPSVMTINDQGLSTFDFRLSTNNYVFPAKAYNPNYTTHVIDFAEPADSLSLNFADSQCCVVIRIYIK
ncbi:MAG: pectate lyase [Paludibacteraceae bacterium]|nr:pectate lyase [Paludibacteraceae bacterium]